MVTILGILTWNVCRMGKSNGNFIRTWYVLDCTIYSTNAHQGYARDCQEDMKLKPRIDKIKEEKGSTEAEKAVAIDSTEHIYGCSRSSNR